MRESELLEEPCQMKMENFPKLVPASAKTTPWQQAQVLKMMHETDPLHPYSYM